MTSAPVDKLTRHTEIRLASCATCLGRGWYFDTYELVSEYCTCPVGVRLEEESRGKLELIDTLNMWRLSLPESAREGWDFFNSDGTIQKDDELDKFETDDEAIAWVVALLCQTEEELMDRWAPPVLAPAVSGHAGCIGWKVDGVVVCQACYPGTFREAFHHEVIAFFERYAADWLAYRKRPCPSCQQSLGSTGTVYASEMTCDKSHGGCGERFPIEGVGHAD